MTRYDERIFILKKVMLTILKLYMLGSCSKQKQKMETITCTGKYTGVVITEPTFAKKDFMKYCI
jgi:hypothetical protein